MSSIKITKNFERQLAELTKEAVSPMIEKLASHFKFDINEANALLGMDELKIERKQEKKTKKVEPKFPLPYSGTVNKIDEEDCHALCRNSGLYTQCTNKSLKDGNFCKKCQTNADKNDGVPEFGTIEMRLAVDIFDYIDPKGRKLVPYTKIMKKLNLTEEQVNEEAEKLDMVVIPKHFENHENAKTGGGQVKQGGGVKGRPKKTKKVVEIAEEPPQVDLFASLVADMSSQEEEPKKETSKKESAKKAVTGLVKPQVSNVTETVVIQEKPSIQEEPKKESDKKESAKKAVTGLVKPQVSNQEEEPKKESDKKESDKKESDKKESAKKAVKKQVSPETPVKEKKTAKKKTKEEPVVDELSEMMASITITQEPQPEVIQETPTNTQEEPEEPEEEEEVVKAITYEGTRYLYGKKSFIVYDYELQMTQEIMKPLGHYNPATKIIAFNKPNIESDEEDDEEEEEEYEEED